mgnify:CR=1 FL=1
MHAPTTAPFAVAWDGAPEVHLPGGILAFEPADGAGIAFAKLCSQHPSGPLAHRRRADPARGEPSAARGQEAVAAGKPYGVATPGAAAGLVRRCSSPPVPGVGVDVRVSGCSGRKGLAPDLASHTP